MRNEILLIDDDSPDNCPQICDNYARDYINIKTIHLCMLRIISV